MDNLIIGTRGFPITTGEVRYLLEQFWTQFPGRSLNPLTVRQSVISMAERKEISTGHSSFNGRPPMDFKYG